MPSLRTPDFPNIKIRRAEVRDAGDFLALVDALADYEQLERPTVSARERLLRDTFGPDPRIEAYLAVVDDTPAGYAIVLESYSSFLALPTLYLEDLFVLPEFRRRGAGMALFLAMATLARQRDCGRMEWTVLDWNQLARDFYLKLGASYLREWHLFRLSREDLAALPDVPAV